MNKMNKMLIQIDMTNCILLIIKEKTEKNRLQAV